MDKKILGILMLKLLTFYEVGNIKRMNFKLMCSDSLSSMQVVQAIRLPVRCNMASTTPGFSLIGLRSWEKRFKGAEL